MPILIIPYNQDPRRSVLAPSIHYVKPFVLEDADFPAIIPHTPEVAPLCSTSTVALRPWPVALRDCVAPSPTHVHQATKSAASDVSTDALLNPAASAAVLTSTLMFPKFLELPQELRLIIWDLAIRGQPYLAPDGRLKHYLDDTVEIREYVKTRDNPERPLFHPPICSVSRGTMEEGVAVLIEGSKFMVASIQDNAFLRAFLNAAPGRLQLCRNLSFDYFSRFPSGYEKNADLELAAACSGLRTIKLTFHYEPITLLVAEGAYEDGLTRQPCSAESLFTKFRLNRLLACDMLKTIILEHTSYHSAAGVEALEGLGDLMSQQFAMTDRSQKVNIHYARQITRRFRY